MPLRFSLKRDPRLNLLRTLFLLVGAVLTAAPGVGQPAQQPPTGVVTLPQDAPPTGLQAPLPPQALPIPKPDKPRRASPDLKALGERLRNRPVTLEDAIAIALATNRSLELAGEALLHSQGRVREAWAAFNPTLSGSMAYTLYGQSQSFEFNGQRIQVSPDMQFIIGAQATLPLDITGLLRAATDQAKFLEVATRLDINRTRNQIVGEVKTAFYEALRAQALVRVATENLQNSLDRLADAQKRLAAGTVARFDVVRAQTDVANAQQQLITARTNVSLRIAALNNAIGLEINTPLQLSPRQSIEMPTGVAVPGLSDEAIQEFAAPKSETSPIPRGPNAAPAEPPPIPSRTQERPDVPVTFDELNLGPDYEAALKEAMETRPEILQADANIAAAKKGLLQALRSRLPTFGLSWNLTYNPTAFGFAPIETQWTAVAQITIPLFDGGIANARAQQARADISQAETQRRQAEDLVALEVRTAYLNLVQARNQVAVASQSLEQAREGFRLARVRYNAGVSQQPGISPLIEVSDAQAALVQAEANLVNALFGYNNSRANLDRAIGRYSFVMNGPGYPKPPSPKAVGRPESGGKR